MGWHDSFRIVPRPAEAVVHERSKPSVPFGFRKGSGVDWKPAGPERRSRDEATVDWCQKQRDDP